ncbi:hypothetical protein AAU61_18855 [Desulfocarbo indianensis]|nr:hypothetical protein AAU61_18855 [Desulfocarbo indianensis]
MPPAPEATKVLIISELGEQIKKKLQKRRPQGAVLAAATAEQGVKLLAGGGSEIVLLHLGSDWEPDLESLRRVRAFFPGLPVVVLAECSTVAGAEACARLSTQGYLRLPAGSGEIWRALDAALETRQGGASFPALHGVSHQEVLQAAAVIHAGHRQGLTPAAVAREVHLSRNHLASLFKAATGHTLSGYINLCRVASAMRLIGREPGLGFSRVAERSGFSSESYLSKVFKRWAGSTPKEFRQAMADKGPAAADWLETIIRAMFERPEETT